MKCPKCESEMLISCNFDFNDIMNMVKDKMTTGKLRDPEEAKINGYSCFECGYSIRKEKDGDLNG